MNRETKKAVVVYFSHRGENYVNGKIVDLKVGNTQVAAKMIAEVTHADLFEIQPVKEYPYSYNDCTRVAKVELNEKLKIELVKDMNLDDYELIYLGYPNWWGTMPMAVFAFLHRHDLTGKTICAFCTHEGSGMGNSEYDLLKEYPRASIKKGLAINGSRVKDSMEDIKNWLERLSR